MSKNMSQAIKRPLLVIAQQLRAYSIQLESIKVHVPDDCPKNTTEVLRFVSDAVIRNTQVPEETNPQIIMPKSDSCPLTGDTYGDLS